MSIVNVDIGDVGKIVDGVFTGVDSLFTSDEEREAAKLQAFKALNEPHMLQALANIQSAKHVNWFVAGGRPALIWICAASLLYQWLIKDFITILLVSFHGQAQEIVPLLPTIDGSMVTGLVFSLLGLGAMRSWEKAQGVAREQR